MIAKPVNPLQITAQQVYPFVKFQQNIGAPVDRLLDKYKVPILDFENSEDAVSESNVFKFIDATSKMESYKEYVFDVSREVLLGTTVYSELLNCAGSGWSALAHVVQLLNKITPTPLYWLKRAGHISWFYRGQHPVKDGVRNSELCVIDRIIDYIDAITGQEFRPEVIKLQTSDRGNIASYGRYASAKLILNEPVTALAIPHKMLLRPSRTHESSVFINDVRSIIAGIENSQLHLATDITAEACCVSRRTFQRRLTQHNTNFRALCDEEIFNRSRKLLMDSSISITGVSRRMGFSVPANFTRSFRRITGISPEYYKYFIAD